MGLPDDCPAHCALEKKLAEIDANVKEVLKRLSGGDVTFATLSVRVTHLEKLVYGCAGAALLAMVTAIASVVIKV